MLYSDSVAALDLPYLNVILEAARKSSRSARDVSLAATGQPSTISMIKRCRVPSVERVRLLCEELGLEFYVGPPREVPASIAALLELEDDRSEKAAVRALKRLLKFDIRYEAKLEAPGSFYSSRSWRGSPKKGLSEHTTRGKCRWDVTSERMLRGQSD